jgi:hypothetical protein
LPPHFALGSREEAAYVAETLGAAFAETEDALAWLETQARRRKAQRRRVRVPYVRCRYRDIIPGKGGTWLSSS